MFFAQLSNSGFIETIWRNWSLRSPIHLCFSLALVLFSYSAVGLDDKPGVPERVEALTQSLHILTRDYQSAFIGVRSDIVDELISVAVERGNLMRSQIENNPGLVISAAIPSSIRARMPAKAQAHIESIISLSGEIEVVYEDYSGGYGHLKHFLRGNDRGPISLHFETLPSKLATGSLATVTGIFVPGIRGTGGSMAMRSDEDVLTLAAKGGKRGGNNGGAPAPTTGVLGDRKTLVILVNFEDLNSEPYTREFAEDLILGTTSNYFHESSSGQTWLSGDVLGWYTIPVSSAVCDRNAIAVEAEKAAAATGIDLEVYSHRMYVFPQIACGWWGLSSVGGDPSRTWITGKLKLGVTAHELGHSFGLYHSQSLDCGDTTLGVNCTQYQYGDTLDMMGSSSFAHFNPFQKEILGWLNTQASPSVETIQTSGTYLLESYAAGSGLGMKALKILKSVDPITGKRSWYYVHARQAIGFDSGFAANSNVLNGVSILQGTEENRNSSFLLDMTPGSGDSIYLEWNDPALEVGQSFEDPIAGFTITTDWITETQAAVSVDFGEAAVDEFNVELAADRSQYSLGQTAYLTTTVTSGGWPLADIAVSLSITKANGSEVRVNGVTNQSGMFTYALRIKRKDPAGTYQAVTTVGVNDVFESNTTLFQIQ